MDARIINENSLGLSAEAMLALSTDANALALIKAYLAIPDEAVKRKLRRLAEEIAVPAKRVAKAV